jgi:lipoprotein-anchoring transpeptidase ErfK/SrfK
VTIVEEKAAGEDRFGRTSHGLWLAMRDLLPARVSTFHGETVEQGVDFGWVVADRARVWSAPTQKGKPTALRDRFARVAVRDRAGPMVKVEEGTWMLAADLAIPTVAPAPTELSRPSDRWIDVDLATQTLVAYEGSRPVFATLVSSGRGGAGSGNETPTGVHRVWVKLTTTDMASSERGEGDAHYSLDDVPYVQFFDHSVALHGTYWHADFGHIHSHGCVNLAIADAKWLFEFTEPRLPPGWVAVYPTLLDDATIVRVR